MKKALLALLALAMLFTVTACFESDADVASKNLSKSADQFEIPRKIVFFNGITDKYLLTIEGFCSLGNDDEPGELSVTCKDGPKSYKKHFLGLSYNVSYFVEQVEGADVSTNHYRVIFKLETIVLNFDRP